MTVRTRERPTSVIAKFGNFEFPLAERYRFERELGSGAMGTVYLARDLRLGRAVAVKLLHPMLTNELGIKRFQGEIRIAAGLHHQNIVALHESGEADGRLFYVMDYLGGETLRARLQREKQLPVDDALRITEQVADALQYAHDHGVVHRDVKPENIILAEGRACILDFGLARALGDVDAQRLTASGLAVGTPHYLSPEQAGAEKEVGPAADQYGLACVLYEMLVGEPPFTGPTASAIAMRHITEVPPPLKGRRRSVPDAVDVAVRRAMEKVPADRWGSVDAFARATVAHISSEAHVIRMSARLKSLSHVVPWTSFTALLAILGGATVLATSSPDIAGMDSIDDGFRRLTNRTIDTARYVVFPQRKGDTKDASSDASQQLADALAKWSGVSVVSAMEVRDATRGRGTGDISADEARAIARNLRAGRFVIGEVVQRGTTVRPRFVVGDAVGRSRPRVVSLDAAEPDSGEAFASNKLAFAVLFGSEFDKHADAAFHATSSRAALSWFLNGRTAVHHWNLARADSAFSLSVRFDPAFPQALLALAYVREWSRDDAPEVGGLVARALGASDRLAQVDKMHANALKELEARHFPEACIRYDSLVSRDSLDFDAWLGVSECNRRDRTVVRNSIGPTGHSFRSSQHRATEAVFRAFDLLPDLDACCVARADEMLRRVLITSTTHVRFGWGANPDTLLYGAYPEIHADTIAFAPLPIGGINRAPPKSHAYAVQQQRSKFFALAAKRVAQFPRSANALEQLGEAMELLGDAAAVDTIRRARTLSASDAQMFRLAATEVWLRLKYATPGNTVELKRVRALAESLLVHASAASPKDASLVASLAALIGDADQAARLSEHIEPENAERGVPLGLLASARAYLAYAALGGPVDSLHELETRVENGIANGVLPSQQPMVRAMWLSRTARLAFPVYRGRALSGPVSSDPVLAAEAAFVRGDRRLAHQILDAAGREREHILAADLTIDGLYPQAWLFAALGDTAAALKVIAPSLDGLRSMPVKQLANPPSAGSLVRAMSLRAVIGMWQGDRESGRKWSSAVAALRGTVKASVASKATRGRVP